MTEGRSGDGEGGYRARRDTRGERGYDWSGGAGMTEGRSGDGEGGTGRGEIPAASAGMTELFCGVALAWVGRERWGWGEF